MSRQLLPHQQKILDQILANPQQKRWGLFLEMGLGKTSLACAIAGALKYNYDHVIILCPPSLIATWKREIEIDGYLSADEYTIFPYSQVSLKQARALTVTDRTIVIFDESHYLKNPASKRSRYFIKLLKTKNPFVISMTGTPDPRDITDLWIQAYLLKAWTGGPLYELNYVQFQNVYGIYRQFAQFKKLVGERNRDLLLRGFAGKAFFIKKEDVIDLPEKTYETKYYELTPEQRKHLINLKKDAMSQAEITSDYIMASMHNYLAICSGFMSAKFDEQGNQYPERKIIDLNKNPKLDILRDVLEDLNGKQVIIFCSYHKEIQLITDLLRDLKLTYCVRHGKQSKEENDISLTTFINECVNVMVATVQSTCVGITMTNCDTMIYYNNTYDLMHRVQSEDRIHRIGQKNTCLYIDITSVNGPDALLLKNLKNKKINMDETFRLFLEAL